LRPEGNESEGAAAKEERETKTRRAGKGRVELVTEKKDGFLKKVTDIKEEKGRPTLP